MVTDVGPDRGAAEDGRVTEAEAVGEAVCTGVGFTGVGFVVVAEGDGVGAAENRAGETGVGEELGAVPQDVTVSANTLSTAARNLSELIIFSRPS